MIHKNSKKVIDLLSDHQDSLDEHFKVYKIPKAVSHKHSSKYNDHKMIKNAENRYVYELWNATQDIAKQRYQEQHKNNKSNKESLGIYQFQSKKENLLNKQKLYKCKVCNKKVYDGGYQFQCEKCQKKCHIACLFDPQQCPRCKYNTRLGRYNKPFVPNLKVKDYSRKIQNQKLKKLQNKIKSSDDNQNETDSLSNFFNALTPQKEETKYNFTIKLSQVPSKFNQQVKQFITKQKQINIKNYQIAFPIPQQIISKYNFIKYFVKQKIIQAQLPPIQILPNHFNNLIFVWNYICFHEFALKSNEICALSLQNFQQSLKLNPISTFITPLLKLYFKQFKPSHPTNLFKLLYQQNQQNLLDYSAHYFWPIMILQIMQNQKSVDAEIQNKFKQMLKQFHQKRTYEIKQFEQKINILHFLGVIVQNNPFFKNIISEHSKNRLQQRQKIQKHIDCQKFKLKQKFRANNEQLNKVLELIRKQKLNINLQFNKQVQDFRLQLDLSKKKQIQILQTIRNQTKQLKKDQQMIEYYYDLHCFNKIIYLGKDKLARLYFHIIDTQANDIIFVNFRAQTYDNTKDSNNYSKWGFYHGQKIQYLIQTLNQAGVNQNHLKSNLVKLFNYGLIRSSSSQKCNLPKIKQYCQKVKTVSPQQQAPQKSEEEKSAHSFLKNNIKQINLSQLRKLLIQSHRIYSKLISEYFGVWKVDGQYGQRIKNEKFRNIKQIIQFVLRIGFAMYSLQEQPQKKKRGKAKAGALLWVSRSNCYYSWKKLLQSSTKNPEVFMYALILYLQVINASRCKIDPRQIYCKRKHHKNPRQIQFLNQKSSTSQQHPNDSWSGSIDQLRNKKKSSSDFDSDQ